MPKHEPMTPKAIANRIKAKGLQKLRWYCQMCEKQCRDENGFKCHTMSESHQRQLLLVAESPNKYVSSFSREFEEGFVELLSRRFGTKRVHANMVYQEYIHDRHHLHMNATQWETLTQFVKWLGRKGVCTVDQTEKGWFITYIDRDPETIRRQEALAKKERMDKDDQEQLMDFINKQVKRAKEEVVKEDSVYTELKKQSEDEKVSFKMPAVPAATKKELAQTSALDAAVTSKASNSDSNKKKTDGRKRTMNLEELIKEEELKKEKINRKDYWLTKGVVVKITTKSLGDKFYKKKGVIMEVVDKYAGIVKVIGTDDVVKLDQVHLETVIPAIGKPIRVLNGAYRGHNAILVSLNEDNYCCTIKIDSGPLNGRMLEGIQYEDISKIF